MAMKSEYEVKISASTDQASFEKAKRSIDEVLQRLDKKQFSLSRSATKDPVIAQRKQQIIEMEKEIQRFREIYSDAFNKSLGTMNLSKLNNGLNKQKINLKLVESGFATMGTTGSKSFRNLVTGALTTNRSLEHTKTIVDSMMETMGNTIKWSISSSALNTMTGYVEQAYGYTKKLDKSLTDIRIVSGKSADEMARFAKEANTAAKGLGATTTEYTDASLIYFQQGKNAQEVKEMTDITVKMANVLGIGVEEASNYMTAIWNNFAEGGENLEYYADVITKLGAATASSAEEISEGLSKFSAIASTSGLSYELSSSLLATITSVTRQSADIVGNGLKTILSRIQGLRLGETLEDGTDLTKYSEAMAKAGIQIKDTTGEMKDANVIFKEMHDSWENLSRAQRLALAQTVGGAHQYNLLVTAMEHWDDVVKNVNMSMESSGELNEQNNIFLESTEAKLKKLEASKEKLFNAFDLKNSVGLGADALILFNEGLALIMESAGGLVPVLTSLSGILVRIGSKNIAQGVGKIAENLVSANKNAEITAREMEIIKTLKEQGIEDKIAKKVVDEKDEFLKKYNSVMTDEQHNILNSIIEREAAIASEKEAWDEALKSLKAYGLELNKLDDKKGKKDFDESNFYVSLSEDVVGYNEGKIEENRRDNSKANLKYIRKQAELQESMNEEIQKKIEEANKKIMTAFKSPTDVKIDKTTFKNAVNGYEKGIGDFINSMNKNLDKLKIDDKIKEQLKNATNSITNDFNKLEKSINKEMGKINASILQKLRRDLGEIQKKIEEAGVQISQEAKDAIDKVNQELDENNVGTGSQNIDKQKRETESDKDTFEKTAKFQKTIESISQGFGGFLDIIGGLETATGVIDTFMDDSISGLDKFLKVIIGVGMALPTVVYGLMSINSALKGLTVAEAIAASSTTGLAAAFQLLKGPIGWITLAFSALTIGLTIFSNRQKQIAAETKAEMEAIEDQKKRLGLLLEGENSFSSQVSKYEGMIKGLGSLTKGTTEYEEALKNTNKAAEGLIDTFELIEGIDYTIDEYGNIIINSKKLKNKQIKQEQKAELEKGRLDLFELEKRKEETPWDNEIETALGMFKDLIVDIIGELALIGIDKLSFGTTAPVTVSLRGVLNGLTLASWNERMSELSRIPHKFRIDSYADLWFKNFLDKNQSKYKKEDIYSWDKKKDKKKNRQLSNDFQDYTAEKRKQKRKELDEYDHKIDDKKNELKSAKDQQEAKKIQAEIDKLIITYNEKVFQLDALEKISKEKDYRDAVINNSKYYDEQQAVAKEMYQEYIKRELELKDGKDDPLYTDLMTRLLPTIKISDIADSVTGGMVKGLSPEEQRKIINSRINNADLYTLSDEEIKRMYAEKYLGYTSEQVKGFTFKDNVLQDDQGKIIIDDNIPLRQIIDTLASIPGEEKKEIPLKSTNRKDVIDFYLKNNKKYSEEELKEADFDDKGNFIDKNGKVLIDKKIKTEELLEEIYKNVLIDLNMRNTAIESLTTPEAKKGLAHLTNLLKGPLGEKIKQLYGEGTQRFVASTYAKGEVGAFTDQTFLQHEKLSKLSNEQILQMFGIKNESDIEKKLGIKYSEEVVDKIQRFISDVRNAIEKGFDLTKFIEDIEKVTTGNKGIIDKLHKGKKDLTDDELKYLEQLEKKYQSLGHIKDRNSKRYVDELERINETLEKEQILANMESYSEKVDKFIKDIASATKEITLTDFKNQLDDLLNQDYKISVAIQLDGQSDFDNTVDEMNSLEEMASKIGEKFIVSAKDVEELRDAFPGITDDMQILADEGTKLSQEAVEQAVQSAKKRMNLEREVAIQNLERQKDILEQKALVARKMGEIIRDAAKGEISTEQAKEKIANKIIENEALNEKAKATFKQNLENDTTRMSKENAQAFADNWITSYAKSLDENKKWAEGMIQNQQAVLDRNLAGVKDAAGYNLKWTDEKDFKNPNPIEFTNEKPIDIEGLSADDIQKYDEEMAHQVLAYADALFDMVNNKQGKIDELRARGVELNKILDNIATGKGSKKDQSKAEANKVDKLKDQVDAYHDINIALKNISNQLRILERQEKKLLGQAKLDNLRKQFEWIEKEIMTLNKKISIAEGEAARLRSVLSKSGVTFDGHGLVSNYASVYQAQINYVNAVIAKYNSLNADGQKAYKDTLDKAKSDFEEFKKNLKEYDDTITNTIPDLRNDIQEAYDKQIELQVEGFEMEITIRLDMAEAERNWNDFKTKIIKDIDNFDILGLTKGKLENYYSYYKDNQTGIVQKTTEHVNKILKELQQMDQTGKSDVYGDDRTKAMEDLKEYYNILMDNMTAAHDLADEIRQSYLDMMDKVVEKFNKQIQLYQTIDGLIEHDKNIIGLIYGDDAYSALDKFYQKQEENNNNSLDFHRREVEFWQKEMDTAEKGSEAWEKAKENWLNAVNAWNGAIEKSIQNLQDKYLNTINSIFEELNSNVTGGLGLDYVEEEWGLINKNADLYLDNVNAIYETQKLQNKYLDAIEKSKDPETQKKLNDLMNKEIEGLREQDKLSKYDIERAELKYQLALKQIALEEAQQNKTSMRLRRDSQGNYSYQYVADEDKVSNLQQEMSDLYNQLYNLDKNAYQDNLNQIFDIWREFQEKMAEAAKINDPEEREARELLLKQQYGELINSLVGENENIKSNLYQSTFSHLFELYGQDFENYEQMTQAQKDILDQYISDEESARGMAFDNLFGLYNENLENFNTMAEEQKNILMESMVPQWDSAIQQMADRIVGEGGFEGVYKEAFERIDGATKDYGNSLKELENQAGVNFDNIKNGTDKVIDRTQDLIQDNKTLINTYREELDAIRGVIAELDKLINKYNKSYEAAKRATEQAHRYWMTEQQKNAAINGNVRHPVTGEDFGSGSFGGGFGNGGAGLGTGNGKIDIGDAVRVKSSDAKAWYTSLGIEVKPWADQAAAVGKAWNDQFYIWNVANGRIALAKSPNASMAIAWLNRHSLVGYDTGGYTGEWNSKDGKLALLHQKEMVLNAKDTKNMLDIVKITRDIANNINASVLPNLLSLNAFGNDNIGAMVDKGIEQTVNINANFPEAKDALEIENALNNLINKATQHILKR